MATNDFKVWGSSTAGGSGGYTPAAYAALSNLATGVVPGVADPLQANTAWRQASTAAKLLGDFIVQQINQNAVDAGNTTTLLSQLTLAIQSLSRVRLGAPITIYVNPSTGNDSTNTGLSSGSPFLTIQHAWTVLLQSYDLVGNVATIQLADGTYTSGLVASGEMVGAIGPVSIIVQGNVGTPANVTFNFTGTAISAVNNAQLTVTGMLLGGLLGSGQSGNGISVGTGGIVLVGASVQFGTCAAAHMLVQQNGQININNACSIVAAAPKHISASGAGSSVNYGALTVTITGSPAFSTNFFSADTLALIDSSSASFSGAATGTRWLASANAVIKTATGPNNLPGNVNGSSTTGGQGI